MCVSILVPELEVLLKKLCGFSGLHYNSTESAKDLWCAATPSGLADRPRNANLFIFGITPADLETIRTRSGGAVTSICTVSAGAKYEASSDCGYFSGLRFGPVVPGNDSVFEIVPSASVRTLIAIDGRPFLFEMSLPGGGRGVFLGSAELADVDFEVGGADFPVEMFSRFAAYVIALRHMVGEACLQPPANGGSGCVIVDDPLLRSRYGHLDIQTLPEFTSRHHFHLTIAFIPHSWWTSARRIVDLFRSHPERLSICFHGNDHTGAEFASMDESFLNYALRTARERMRKHSEKFQLACSRVMVFPQGNFSMQAMEALSAHGFLAAVNTVPYPREAPGTKLTLGDVAAPAVMRYGRYPLFLRKPAKAWTEFDVAACLFFGRPILVVEHHEIGREMETLARFAELVNTVAPGIQWRDLEQVVKGSYLTQVTAGGERITRRYVNENVPLPNEQLPMRTPGMGWRMKAFLRRRLSELRDNYLSRSPGFLRFAKSVQKRLWR